MIRWHEVTWYSRWGAILLFLVVVPVLCFYIGTQYELASQSVIKPLPTASVSTVSPKITCAQAADAQLKTDAGILPHLTESTTSVHISDYGLIQNCYFLNKNVSNSTLDQAYDPKVDPPTYEQDTLYFYPLAHGYISGEGRLIASYTTVSGYQISTSRTFLNISKNFFDELIKDIWQKNE